MIRKIKLFEQLLALIYPRVCMTCQKPLETVETPICIRCLLDLPIIGISSPGQKKVAEKFYGIVPLNFAIAYMIFEKNNITQKLVHQLKYKGKREIGTWLGKKLGEELKNTSFRDEIDLLVPIPLHPTKEKVRGYNQALILAEAIGSTLEIPVMPDALIKVEHNTSQTTKSRVERFLNTENKFRIKDEERVAGKRICIVDDVVTTGATLEAAAECIIAAKAAEVSIITIASAF